MTSRKKQARHGGQTHSVDNLVLRTTRTLIRDFQSSTGEMLYQNTLLALSEGSASTLRCSKPELQFDLPPLRFKMDYQIASLDKRHRYRNDIYSDDELQEMAIAKFLDVQNRLSELDWDSIANDEKLWQILVHARRVCAYVLGAFDEEECRQSARFGNGASVGVPARSAHLAQRFEAPISGSKEQISWWRLEYDDCPHFQEWLREHLRLNNDSPELYADVETLKLTLVPKSHKSLRVIMANTTIGSYMSSGIATMIRKRMRRKLKLDVRELQHKHREYSMLNSLSRRHLTMDLSSASDSISVQLAALLLPNDWYDFMSRHRIGTVELPDGSFVESNTFCTMGIGYTFDLQTLIFFALIHGCQFYTDRQNLRGTFISVYGDDLIFGSHLNIPVRNTFEGVGILVNEDKTFVNEYFRESCGGDYYHGWDVRPFQPETGSYSVGSLAYEALLYKFVNGLLARWEEHQIWDTLQMLLAEIEKVAGKVKLVPKTHPEDSGVRIGINWRSGTVTLNCVSTCRVEQPKFRGHGVYSFKFLKMKLKEKEEERHGPYYWSVIRGVDLVLPVRSYTGDCPIERAVLISDNRIRRVLMTVCNDFAELRRGSSPSALIRRTIRLEKTSPGKAPSWKNKKKPLTSDFVEPDVCTTEKTFVRIPHSGQYTCQKGTSCFEP